MKRTTGKYQVLIDHVVTEHGLLDHEKYCNLAIVQAIALAWNDTEDAVASDVHDRASYLANLIQIQESINVSVSLRSDDWSY
jgi:hypothetical protein